MTKTSIFYIFIIILIIFFLFIIIFLKFRSKSKIKKQQQEFDLSCENFIDGNKVFSTYEFFKMYKKFNKSGLKNYKHSGIYILINLNLQKFYIGQSNNIFTRINKHFTGNGNGNVYADWSRLNHKFQITVVKCPQEYLNTKERDLIKYYDSKYPQTYNISKGNKDSLPSKFTPIITEKQNIYLKNLLCKNFKITDSNDFGKKFAYLKIINNSEMYEVNDTIAINLNGMLNKSQISMELGSTLIGILQNDQNNLKLYNNKLSGDRSLLLFLEIIPRNSKV